MSEALNYKRKFLIFQTEDRGYEGGHKPSGFVRIETRNGIGKLWAIAHDLKRQEANLSYKLYLISTYENTAGPVCVGKLKQDKNRLELDWVFDPDNVANSGMKIDQMDIAAIVVSNENVTGTNVICPLVAYQDKKKKEWRHLFVPKKQLAGKRPEIKQPETPVLHVVEGKESQLIAQPEMRLSAAGRKETTHQGLSQADTLQKEMPKQDLHKKGELQKEGMRTEGLQEEEPKKEKPQEKLTEERQVEKPQKEEMLQEKGAEAEGLQEGSHQEEKLQEEGLEEERTREDEQQGESQHEIAQQEEEHEGRVPPEDEHPEDMAPAEDRTEKDAFAEPCDVEKLKSELDKNFERGEPFRIKRSDYNWWKITDPVKLNNIFYQCNLRTPVLFNPTVMMAHVRYRHLIVGIYTDKNKKRQYVVCGIPGTHMDRKPLGDMSRWVMVEGGRQKRGSFGYWLIYLDPSTSKAMKLR